MQDREEMSGRKIAIGTAQFGLDYGVANQMGRVAEEDAHQILAYAKSQGVDTIDTATAYGCSEEVLGRFSLDGWKVVSKIGVAPERCEIREWIRSEVEGSLHRLRIPCLHGLLLHRSDVLLHPMGDVIYQSLRELQREGMIQKIGVSVYSPEEFDGILQRYPCDLVQAPLNLVDRRMVDSGWLERLKNQGVEVHIRSVFLQGVLLMQQQAMPSYFQEWSALWVSWEEWLQENQLLPLEACLRYVLGLCEVDRVVVGVESVFQLQEILLSSEEKQPILFPDLRTDDVRLLHPSLWSLSKP